MKSIKPGRGPAALGVWGAVISVAFGIAWTIAAVSMGAPVMFLIFGVLFTITGVIKGIYNYKNATGKNRYSSYDITDDGEEPDPLERRRRRSGEEDVHTEPERNDKNMPDGGFCPYCGAPADENYEFCRRCGRRLP